MARKLHGINRKVEHNNVLIDTELKPVRRMSDTVPDRGYQMSSLYSLLPPSTEPEKMTINQLFKT